MLSFCHQAGHPACIAVSRNPTNLGNRGMLAVQQMPVQVLTVIVGYVVICYLLAALAYAVNFYLPVIQTLV